MVEIRTNRLLAVKVGLTKHASVDGRLAICWDPSCVAEKTSLSQNPLAVEIEFKVLVDPNAIGQTIETVEIYYIFASHLIHCTHSTPFHALRNHAWEAPCFLLRAPLASDLLPQEEEDSAQHTVDSEISRSETAFRSDSK